MPDGAPADGRKSMFMITAFSPLRAGSHARLAALFLLLEASGHASHQPIRSCSPMSLYHCRATRGFLGADMRRRDCGAAYIISRQYTGRRGGRRRRRQDALLMIWRQRRFSRRATRRRNDVDCRRIELRRRYGSFAQHNTRRSPLWRQPRIETGTLFSAILRDALKYHRAFLLRMHDYLEIY